MRPLVVLDRHRLEGIVEVGRVAGGQVGQKVLVVLGQPQGNQRAGDGLTRFDYGEAGVFE